MAVTAIETLKNWFETGNKPTQEQFANLIDSFHHKSDDVKLPANKAVYIDNVKILGAQQDTIEQILDEFITNNGDLNGNYDQDVKTLRRCLNEIATKYNKMLEVIKNHGLIAS